MTAAGGCSGRGAACAASPPTRSSGSLPGWRQRLRQLGAAGWFRSRRRLGSCFRRERLSPGRRERCSASPWYARSSACTRPRHAHRAPRRVSPPALRSTGVAAPIEPPTVASADGLEATAPSGWANMAAPPARRRGVLAHPAPGSGERRDQIAPVPSPIPADAPRTSAPEAPDSPIVREGESFATVLRRWRRVHDGQAALAALDLHDRSFVRGQMALESRLLRVEILLFEHRDHDALAILDGLPLGKVSLPRGGELLTVRGELRVKAGRCDDGRADLAAVLGGSDILAERARNALTHCP